ANGISARGGRRGGLSAGGARFHHRSDRSRENLCPLAAHAPHWTSRRAGGERWRRMGRTPRRRRSPWAAQLFCAVLRRPTRIPQAAGLVGGIAGGGRGEPHREIAGPLAL